MSQGDYLKHKVTATLLKSQSTLPAILTGDAYTSYKRFQLANTIASTSTSYEQLLQTNKQTVFGMELNVSGCSEFKLCKDTNTRPNRELMTINRDCRKTKPYVKHPPGGKSACDCALNRSKSSNPCKCATSF
jgi:hypothetical protein